MVELTPAYLASRLNLLISGNDDSRRAYLSEEVWQELPDKIRLADKQGNRVVLSPLLEDRLRGAGNGMVRVEMVSLNECRCVLQQAIDRIRISSLGNTLEALPDEGKVVPFAPSRVR